MLSYCVHVARCSRFRSEVNRLARLGSLATAALILAIFYTVYLSIYVCRQNFHRCNPTTVTGWHDVSDNSAGVPNIIPITLCGCH